MDALGRRKVLMVMSAPFIAGYLLIALAVDPCKLIASSIDLSCVNNDRFMPNQSIAMLYIGRLVFCGIASGICTAVIPTYICERILTFKYS